MRRNYQTEQTGEGSKHTLIQYWNTGGAFPRAVGMVLWELDWNGRKEWAVMIGAAPHPMSDFKDILSYVGSWGAKLEEVEARTWLGDDAPEGEYHR